MLLPGICGPTISLESMGGKKEPLADAMLFEPIPYRAALAEGATHVLVLRTRPDGVNLVRKQATLGQPTPTHSIAQASDHREAHLAYISPVSPLYLP